MLRLARRILADRVRLARLGRTTRPMKAAQPATPAAAGGTAALVANRPRAAGPPGAEAAPQQTWVPLARRVLAGAARSARPGPTTRPRKAVQRQGQPATPAGAGGAADPVAGLRRAAGSPGVEAVPRGAHYGVPKPRLPNSRPRSAPGSGQPTLRPGRRAPQTGEPASQPDPQTRQPGRRAPRPPRPGQRESRGQRRRAPRPGLAGWRAPRPGRRAPGRRYPRAISACRRRASPPTAPPRRWPGRPVAGYWSVPPRRAAPWR